MTDYNAALGGLAGMAQAQQFVQSGSIDRRTEEVAKMLCRGDRTSPDFPFKIEAGGFIPSWTMYISEATKLIRESERIDYIKRVKNEKT